MQRHGEVAMQRLANAQFNNPQQSLACAHDCLSVYLLMQPSRRIAGRGCAVCTPSVKPGAVDSLLCRSSGMLDHCTCTGQVQQDNTSMCLVYALAQHQIALILMHAVLLAKPQLRACQCALAHTPLDLLFLCCTHSPGQPGMRLARSLEIVGSPRAEHCLAPEL